MSDKALNAAGLAHIWNKIVSILAAKQDNLTFDNTPTKDSTNPVTSDGVYNSIQSHLSDYAKKSDIPTTEETVAAVLEAIPTWQGGEY